MQLRLLVRCIHISTTRAYSQPVARIRPGYVATAIKSRTMKLESPEFRNLFTPQLEHLAKLFKDNNYELKIAGGAVRDLLMGKVPADVDFASTATPTDMKELFERESIRMLHKRGEEHGTITCRIDDKENFEITTLRVDVVCDGRRAEVEYTKNWQLDANRRDLTINSLFLDLDGNVVDYFGGIDDIEKRRVAFVGEAAQRIQEDYLRILRYFRFFGRISDTDAHETATIDAIKANKDGLKGISAERIWTEMKKIVVGRKAPQVIRCMLHDCQLNSYLGLPDDANVDRFTKVYDHFSFKLEPMTLVACLCERASDVAEFHLKTKLSNVERLLGEFVIGHRAEAESHLDNIDWWKSLMVDMDVDPCREKQAGSGRENVLQLAMSVGLADCQIDELSAWTMPSFEITGLDLMKVGVKHGPKMRNTLSYLYSMWKTSTYSISREDLLSHALDAEIPEPPSPKNKKRKRENSK